MKSATILKWTKKKWNLSYSKSKVSDIYKVGEYFCGKSEWSMRLWISLS